MGSISTLRVFATIGAIISWCMVGVGAVLTLMVFASGQLVLLGFGLGTAIMGFLALAGVGLLFLGLAIYDRLGQILRVIELNQQGSVSMPSSGQPPAEGNSQGIDADGFETRTIGGYPVKLRPGSGGYLQVLLGDGSLRLFANEERILRYYQSGGR